MSSPGGHKNYLWPLARVSEGRPTQSLHPKIWKKILATVGQINLATVQIPGTTSLRFYMHRLMTCEIIHSSFESGYAFNVRGLCTSHHRSVVLPKRHEQHKDMIWFKTPKRFDSTYHFPSMDMITTRAMPQSEIPLTVCSHMRRTPLNVYSNVTVTCHGGGYPDLAGLSSASIVMLPFFLSFMFPIGAGMPARASVIKGISEPVWHVLRLAVS
jgi:hypothetical protein